MPDVAAPILPKIVLELRMDPATGQMDMKLPSDFGLSMRMLACAMEQVTGQQMKARESASRVKVVGGAALHALPKAVE